MSTYPPEPLFHKFDLDATLNNQARSGEHAVEDVPRQSLTRQTIDDLLLQLHDRYRVNPIILLEGATSVSVEETQIDVSQDPMRHIRDRSRPAYIPGIQVEYFVPFKGDASLFQANLNPFDFNPPRAEVRNGELVFVFRIIDTDVAATKADFYGQLSSVKGYLAAIENRILSFNDELLQKTRARLEGRLQRLEATMASMESLGLPTRGQSPPGPPPKHPVKSPTTEIYDVSLSFAGEDRQYVESVANVLRARGIRVFYDKFEKTSLWGKNLVDYLASIYRDRSRFVVMFISKHYVQKAWPKHERQHAQERALLASGDYILPVRFDNSEVPGLPNTVAYLNLEGVSPEDLANTIAQKLKGP